MTYIKKSPYLELSKPQAIQIGKKIRRERLRANMTQLELADTALGFERSHCFISRMERGVLTKVPRARIKAMAKAMVVDIPSLVGNRLAAQM